jgi:ribosomal protein S27E
VVDNPVPLTRAFHLQCKGCHRTQTAAGRGPLPVMCGQCHRPASASASPG